VPVLDGAIQARFEGGVEFEILRCFAEVVTPILVAESRQPGGVAQDFFLATAFSTLMSSCTQLLLRMGSRVRISLPAAAKIAMVAMVVGSM